MYNGENTSFLPSDRGIWWKPRQKRCGHQITMRPWILAAMSVSECSVADLLLTSSLCDKQSSICYSLLCLCHQALGLNPGHRDLHRTAVVEQEVDRRSIQSLSSRQILRLVCPRWIHWRLLDCWWTSWTYPSPCLLISDIIDEALADPQVSFPEGDYEIPYPAREQRLPSVHPHLHP